MISDSRFVQSQFSFTANKCCVQRQAGLLDALEDFALKRIQDGWRWLYEVHSNSPLAEKKGGHSQTIGGADFTKTFSRDMPVIRSLRHESAHKVCMVSND